MSEVTINKLVLTSSFDELEKIEPFVDELRNEIPFSDSDYDRILLCLNEAASNAIIHGNSEDPQKHVFISASYTTDSRDRLIITVKDEGEGFDPDSIPDPLQEENLLNAGGRGVFLIKEYTDEVYFSENGTKLSLIFKFQK